MKAQGRVLAIYSIVVLDWGRGTMECLRHEIFCGQFFFYAVWLIADTN